MQTVFVTGATGFIGRHLVRELVRRGMRCKCLARLTSTVDSLPTDGVEFVEGTIEEPDSYRAALEGCDVVINVAGKVNALDKSQLFQFNGEACALLADACLAARQPPRLVHISSVAAAGPPPRGKSVRTESDPPQPISLYGRSKLQGEIVLTERASKLPITIIRPGVVYGPGDRKLAETIRVIYRWRLHPVVGFRTPPLSLIHVDDLAQLILLTVERGKTLCSDPASPDGYYFACDDSEFPTYWEFGQRIARSLDQRVFVWPLWRWVSTCIGFSAQTISKLRQQPSLLTVDKVREASVRSFVGHFQPESPTAAWLCTRQVARRLPARDVTLVRGQRLGLSALWASNRALRCFAIGSYVHLVTLDPEIVDAVLSFAGASIQPAPSAIANPQIAGKLLCLTCYQCCKKDGKQSWRKKRQETPPPCHKMAVPILAI